jgi:hypothetical protein
MPQARAKWNEGIIVILWLWFQTSGETVTVRHDRTPARAGKPPAKSTPASAETGAADRRAEV